MVGKCLAKCNRHKAEVTTKDGESKTRLKNHTRSFKKKRYLTDTEVCFHLSF